MFGYSFICFFFFFFFFCLNSTQTYYYLFKSNFKPVYQWLFIIFGFLFIGEQNKTEFATRRRTRFGYQSMFSASLQLRKHFAISVVFPFNTSYAMGKITSRQIDIFLTFPDEKLSLFSGWRAALKKKKKKKKTTVNA